MLYSVVIASILAVAAFGHDDSCGDFRNASACLSHTECGWTIRKGQSCGWCMDPGYTCADAANFDCNLRCKLADVPTYARDSCEHRDNITCDALCETQVSACLNDITCTQISNATMYAEKKFAHDAGCDLQDEDCKDRHQVFFRALNVSLTEYCWGDNSNDASCNLYKAAVGCYAKNCSNDCSDCSTECRDDYINCVFDEECSVAMIWLMNKIDEYGDSGDIFFPYKLKEQKEEYCTNSTTSQYCNTEFDNLWSCLVGSCLEAGCAYSQCNTKFQACYEDEECQSQLFAVLSKYNVQQTPGIAGALINYYCQKDANLTCDNTNFKAVVECYSGKCCWDPDVCVGADQLDGCENPDCLKEACVEVHCLPQFRNCMNDVNCGDAFMMQIEWSKYCEECMDNDHNATYCSDNPAGLNCNAMKGSGAMMYLQYYCWNNPNKCDEDVSNLLQCVVQKCADCGENKDDNSQNSGSGSNQEDEGDAEMCACVFGTCWDSVESCFFDQNCWKLIFGDSKDGYGFEAMMQSVVNDTDDTVLLVPTLIDTKIRNNYCNDKDCSDKFWNLWYCVWPPIYMGDSYSCSSYWRDMSSGCGLSDMLYQHYPECVTTKCMGIADDCLGDPNSACTATYEAAMANGELFLCDFCNNEDCQDDCQTECHKHCVVTSTLKSNYTSRCGATGTQCPQEYRNLANCLYRKCGGESDTLPGAQEPSSVDCKTNGVAKQTGILALILSVVLVVFTL